jgi:hypothetical protein
MWFFTPGLLPSSRSELRSWLIPLSHNPHNRWANRKGFILATFLAQAVVDKNGIFFKMMILLLLWLSLVTFTDMTTIKVVLKKMRACDESQYVFECL